MRRFVLASLVLAGCARPTPSDPPGSQTSETSATRHAAQGYDEVRLDADHRLWVYAPAGASKGGGATKGKPCVVIAPAGAHMFDGMALGEGDVPEHLPYVKEGYVVVAYDVSGPLEGDTLGAAARAARTFSAAGAGVADGKRALDYALGTLGVDPKRIVVAGHSSAATIALTLAENDPRVKACLAYAPIIDVRERLRENLPTLERAVPGLTERLVRFSPLGRIDRLTAPTYLFHARDDDNAPRDPLATFAKGRPNVEFVEVPRGGHYDSMIREGIPGGLRFLQARRLAP